MTIQQIIEELSKPGERSNEFGDILLKLMDKFTPMSMNMLQSWQNDNIYLTDNFEEYCNKQNPILKALIAIELSDLNEDNRRDNNLQELTLNTEI